MKRKPTSLRDFLVTVASVNHPGLKPEHRHFLEALAPFADYTTGRSAYPGMLHLMRAMGKSEDRIHSYAKDCEKLGLIERVNGKAHKGMRAEWRFCLESPAYPDGIDPQVGDKAPQIKERSPASGQSKPRTLADKAPHIGAVPSEPPTKPPSTPSKPLAAKPAAGEDGGGVGKPSGQGDIDTLLDDMTMLYFATTEKVLPVSSDNRKKLRQLMKQRSHEEILQVFKEARNQGIFDGWKFPLIPFFQGYSALLKVAKTKAARKPLSQAVIDASDKAARDIHIKFWDFDDESGSKEPGPEAI